MKMTTKVVAEDQPATIACQQSLEVEPVVEKAVVLVRSYVVVVALCIPEMTDLGCIYGIGMQHARQYGSTMNHITHMTTWKTNPEDDESLSCSTVDSG